MNSITLRKGGFYYPEYEESNNSIEYVKVSGSIGFHLQSTIEVDADVTVSDLMEELMRHEADVDMIFYGSSKGHHIRPFYDEMVMTANNKRDDLVHAEISWASDYFRSERNGKPDEVSIFTQINGIAKKTKEDAATSYNLSQIPMNDWKHLFLRISNSLLVYDFRIDKEDESGTFGTKVITILEANRDMTLYDFIAGFIEEITWYGYPDQRKEKINDIDNIVHLGDNVSAAKLEDKEYELKSALEREDYELAAILKKDIDKLKKS